jgi:hypothetical protein
MQYLFTVPIVISLLVCAVLIDVSPQPGRDELLMLSLASAACLTGVLFTPVDTVTRNSALVTLLFFAAVFALPHIAIQWLPLLRLSVTLFLVIAAALSVLQIFPNRIEPARQFVAIGLVTLFALPIWLGPIAGAAGNPMLLTNLIVAASPLSALAVALDLDVLRTNWFYQHSVLGSLRYEYFSWLGYVALLVALVIAARAPTGHKAAPTTNQHQKRP